MHLFQCEHQKSALVLYHNDYSEFVYPVSYSLPITLPPVQSAIIRAFLRISFNMECVSLPPPRYLSHVWRFIWRTSYSVCAICHPCLQTVARIEPTATLISRYLAEPMKMFWGTVVGNTAVILEFLWTWQKKLSPPLKLLTTPHFISTDRWWICYSVSKPVCLCSQPNGSCQSTHVLV